MSQKYIRFALSAEQKPKTQVWDVLTTSNGVLLGTIRWYGPWRQYCFMPETDAETVFSAGCLQDVEAHIRQLMNERRVET